MKLDIIAGARPNFVKIAPIVKALSPQKIKVRLIHTGQHYDYSMSDSFFEDLDIPPPHENLRCGSGTQAQQTSAIMIAYETLLRKELCNVCLVVGDVNSTLACAITAKKMGCLVGHVEAGIRSYDIKMPEEINRIVTDSITDFFFTTTQEASKNLLSIGVDPKDIFFVGNTMIDSLVRSASRLRKPDVWDEMCLQKREFLVLTMHRPSNVDDRESLNRKLMEIISLAKGRKIVFPVHPRVRGAINSEIERKLILTGPLPYLNFVYLVKESLGVITDSGGVTEECTVLGVPCMTLRTTTERPETVSLGTNVLIGEDPVNLKPYLADLFQGAWKSHAIPEFWDGKAGTRIAAVLEDISQRT